MSMDICELEEERDWVLMKEIGQTAFPLLITDCASSHLSIDLSNLFWLFSQFLLTMVPISFINKSPSIADCFWTFCSQGTKTIGHPKLVALFSSKLTWRAALPWLQHSNMHCMPTYMVIDPNQLYVMYHTTLMLYQNGRKPGATTANIHNEQTTANQWHWRKSMLIFDM